MNCELNLVGSQWFQTLEQVSFVIADETILVSSVLALLLVLSEREGIDSFAIPPLRALGTQGLPPVSRAFLIQLYLLAHWLSVESLVSAVIFPGRPLRPTQDMLVSGPLYLPLYIGQMDTVLTSKPVDFKILLRASTARSMCAHGHRRDGASKPSRQRNGIPSPLFNCIMDPEFCEGFSVRQAWRQL